MKRSEIVGAAVGVAAGIVGAFALTSSSSEKDFVGKRFEIRRVKKQLLDALSKKRGS